MDEFIFHFKLACTSIWLIGDGQSVEDLKKSK